MTIEPVIEIFGQYNGKAINRLRQVVFEEFAKSDCYGMIFTYMWAFDQQADWDYIEYVKSIFEPYNTEFYYVELVAPREIRLERNDDVDAASKISEEAMKHILVVVDIQKDFVDGALGTAEAVAIVGNAAKKIREFDGDIFVTYDTHFENYMNTAEGAKLPVPHCIKGTDGWQLNESIAQALADRKYTAIEKLTFGSVELPERVRQTVGDQDFDLTLIGLCTDICVVSNALILKANFPEKEIYVDASCCAGVTVETHNAALTTMKMCQINILGA